LIGRILTKNSKKMKNFTYFSKKYQINKRHEPYNTNTSISCGCREWRRRISTAERQSLVVPIATATPVAAPKGCVSGTSGGKNCPCDQ
jgi:hypothetical protein